MKAFLLSGILLLSIFSSGACTGASTPTPTPTPLPTTTPASPSARSLELSQPWPDVLAFFPSDYQRVVYFDIRTLLDDPDISEQLDVAYFIPYLWVPLISDKLNSLVWAHKFERSSNATPLTDAFFWIGDWDLQSVRGELQSEGWEKGSLGVFEMWADPSGFSRLVVASAQVLLLIDGLEARTQSFDQEVPKDFLATWLGQSDSVVSNLRTRDMAMSLEPGYLGLFFQPCPGLDVKGCLATAITYSKKDAETSSWRWTVLFNNDQAASVAVPLLDRIAEEEFGAKPTRTVQEGDIVHLEGSRSMEDALDLVDQWLIQLTVLDR